MHSLNGGNYLDDAVIGLARNIQVCQLDLGSSRLESKPNRWMHEQTSQKKWSVLQCKTQAPLRHIILR